MTATSKLHTRTYNPTIQQSDMDEIRGYLSLKLLIQGMLF